MYFYLFLSKSLLLFGHKRTAKPNDRPIDNVPLWVSNSCSLHYVFFARLVKKTWSPTFLKPPIALQSLIGHSFTYSSSSSFIYISHLLKLTTTKFAEVKNTKIWRRRYDTPCATNRRHKKTGERDKKTKTEFCSDLIPHAAYIKGIPRKKSKYRKKWHNWRCCSFCSKIESL